MVVNGRMRGRERGTEKGTEEIDERNYFRIELDTFVEGTHAVRHLTDC